MQLLLKVVGGGGSTKYVACVVSEKLAKQKERRREFSRVKTPKRARES